MNGSDTQRDGPERAPPPSDPRARLREQALKQKRRTRFLTRTRIAVWAVVLGLALVSKFALKAQWDRILKGGGGGGDGDGAGADVAAEAEGTSGASRWIVRRFDEIAERDGSQLRFVPVRVFGAVGTGPPGAAPIFVTSNIGRCDWIEYPAAAAAGARAFPTDGDVVDLDVVSRDAGAEWPDELVLGVRVGDLVGATRGELCVVGLDGARRLCRVFPNPVNAVAGGVLRDVGKVYCALLGAGEVVTIRADGRVLAHDRLEHAVDRIWITKGDESTAAAIWCRGRDGRPFATDLPKDRQAGGVIDAARDVPVERVTAAAWAGRFDDATSLLHQQGVVIGAGTPREDLAVLATTLALRGFERREAANLVVAITDVLAASELPGAARARAAVVWAQGEARLFLREAGASASARTASGLCPPTDDRLRRLIEDLDARAHQAGL